MNSHTVNIGMRLAALGPRWAVPKLCAWTGAPQRYRLALPCVPAETVAQRRDSNQTPHMGRSYLKRRRVNTLTVILFLSVGQPLAHAEWGFVDSVDDFTDERVRFAYYSDDDHRIQLSRHDDNSVWMYITRSKIGSFEPDTPVEYRVDQGMLRDADIDTSRLLERLGQGPTYIWEPDTVGFRVWHGNHEDLSPDPCGFIGDLLSGYVLRVRYHISSLDRDTFSVDLADADDAIVKGLSVDVCVDQE